MYEDAIVLAVSITISSIVFVVLITLITLVCVYGKKYDETKEIKFDNKTTPPETKNYSEATVNIVKPETTETEESVETEQELPEIKSFKN